MYLHLSLDWCMELLYFSVTDNIGFTYLLQYSTLTIAFEVNVGLKGGFEDEGWGLSSGDGWKKYIYLFTKQKYQIILITFDMNFIMLIRVKLILNIVKVKSQNDF